MMEDDSVKAVDKQKIKGCILKWRDSKVLLGCAFFHDLLTVHAKKKFPLRLRRTSVVRFNRYRFHTVSQPFSREVPFHVPFYQFTLLVHKRFNDVVLLGCRSQNEVFTLALPTSCNT